MNQQMDTVTNGNEGLGRLRTYLPLTKRSGIAIENEEFNMRHIRFHVLSVRIAAILLSLNLCGCADSSSRCVVDLAPSLTSSLEGGRANRAGLTEANVDIQRITAKEHGDLFSWLHKGLLFIRVVYFTDNKGKYIDERNGEHLFHEDFLYCGQDGHLVVVSTLPRFSAMIREELDDAKSTDSFLKSMLHQVFFASMGPHHASVIDQDYLKYWKSTPPDVWGDVSEPLIKHSFEILKKYVYAGPTIKNGKWRTVFFVSLRNGSVEKWELNGQVQPFSVDHLTKMVVEKAGTIAQFITIGG